MIRRQTNPRKQGDAGMGLAIGWFASNGYTVCIPLTDSQPYDLVVDAASGLKRVSVRTTTFKERNGNYAVSLRTVGSNTRGTKTVLFDRASCELLFVVTEAGGMYLFPSTEIVAVNRLVLGSKYDKYIVSRVWPNG